MSRAVSVLFLAFLLTGCASMVRYHTPSLDQVPSGSTTVVHSLGFLWGLVPPSRISLEQCGKGGIKEMKVRQGLLDFIITDFTGGLVISYKVKIVCARS